MSEVQARRDRADALSVLKERFGSRLDTREAVRAEHGRDESWHLEAAPDAVILPRSTDEVSEIVMACAEARMPVIAFGAGTSLEGHVTAPQGGLALDMREMNAVLEVNPPDMDVRVQPGVTRKELNAHLRDTGLFFPVDPGADATLGGMAATRASGTNAVRYGTMREAVLGLEAVLADGRIIRTGGRARKSAAGYDLTHLMIGSEGTLGIITELTLRLHGIPEAVAAAVCPFESMEGAVETVIATIQSGVPVARIELLDEVQVAACNAYSKLDLKEVPTLFLEFHGTEASVSEQAERAGALAVDFGGGDFDWATKPEDRNRLWTARHNAYYAALALKPAKQGLVTDVCVPISALARCIAETKADIAETGVLAPLVGHVGDGNFHLILLIDPKDDEELARARAFHDRLVNRALALGGTSTGEHGIGLGKRGFLLTEHGESVAVMRTVKQALDPLGILNPGKIFSG